MKTTFDQAMAAVLATAKDYGIESISLIESVHRVLREDVSADRDFPPFDRVAMDGIAINFDHFDHKSKMAEITGIAAAGSSKQELINRKSCFEVMTGAVLPEGADTVIRYEDINIEGSTVTVADIELRKGQNVHNQGLDRRAGDLIIDQGTRISPAEIGVGASVGQTHVRVSKLPKCIIISSGNELVNIHEEPKAHQIRKSNSHQIGSMLSAKGIVADVEHLNDNEEEIENKLSKFLDQYDVIIVSGGVSKGKFDFIPGVLDKLGVERLFHKVEQRPGKPLWFGQHGGGTLVFALPGNPVSSFMCALAFFSPWLLKSLGSKEEESTYAMLSEDVSFKPNLTFFLQVRVKNEKGQLKAYPIKGKGSGDLANLVDADGFLIIPQGYDNYTAGSAHPFISFRNLI